MSSAPSWNNLARILRGEPSSSESSLAGSIKSEDNVSSKRRPITKELGYRNVNTTDTKLFPPPKRTKEDVLKAKRDRVTGWVIKGKQDDGSGGVNIIKKDETLISLAFEGKTTLSSQLAVVGKPIIGLDYIVEYIDPDVEAQLRVYHCTLCSVFRTAATILEHICSHHHRVRVLRKQFPSEANVFLLPDKKTINRNPGLIQIAVKRAMEHELVYGRGEVQVRYERPQFPEKDLDAEEQNEIIDTKQLEYLELTMKEMKSLKIQTQSEYRLVKKIVDILTEEMADFQIAHPAFQA